MLILWGPAVSHYLSCLFSTPTHIYISYIDCILTQPCWKYWYIFINMEVIEIKTDTHRVVDRRTIR